MGNGPARDDAHSGRVLPGGASRCSRRLPLERQKADQNERCAAIHHTSGRAAEGTLDRHTVCSVRPRGRLTGPREACHTPSPCLRCRDRAQRCWLNVGSGCKPDHRLANEWRACDRRVTRLLTRRSGPCPLLCCRTEPKRRLDFSCWPSAPWSEAEPRGFHVWWRVGGRRTTLPAQPEIFPRELAT